MIWISRHLDVRCSALVSSNLVLRIESEFENTSDVDGKRWLRWRLLDDFGDTFKRTNPHKGIEGVRLVHKSSELFSKQSKISADFCCLEQNRKSF